MIYNLLKRILILNALLLGSLITLAQDPDFHIYLCFGQSNMQGNSAPEAQDKTGVNARFQVMGAVNCNSGGKSYTLGKWQTANAPIVRCDAGLGPTDYFGRAMVAALPSNIKIGVVAVAVAGADIALFDKANYATYVQTAPTYMKNIINQYGGNPYGRLVEVAKLAQKDGVIKGILFHQGETNSGQNTWPAKVKAVYNNLIKDLNLDPSKTPFLAGELVTSAFGGLCAGHNSVIATLPSVIPNSYVISAAGLACESDKLHFTNASQRLFGPRYAQKMLQLVTITGVENENDLQTSASAFPNPFSSELNVSVKGDFQYELMTTDGNILTKGIAEGSISIAQETPKGLYLLKITQNGNSKVMKVVKE